MTEWPKHPDGRPMKMGEMTRDQQRVQIKASVQRVKAEFEAPEMQAHVARVLNQGGGNA